MNKEAGFLRERICDALFLAVMLVFYGGLALAAFSLCIAQWVLCGIGLVLAVVAIVTISIVCVMNDLCDIARHNTPVSAAWNGFLVIAEAAACIFLYLTVIPVMTSARELKEGVTSLKSE